MDLISESEEDETISLSEIDRKQISTFQQMSKVVPTAVIDTASIRLGETDRRMISAIRAAIIAKETDVVRATVPFTKIYFCMVNGYFHSDTPVEELLQQIRGI